MIKNGQVIPLTGPLTTQIHLRSVCFDSKAATTQMNVSLCYDSISRASLVFPLSLRLMASVVSLCGAALPRDPLPSTPETACPARGHVWMTPWYAG